MDDRIQNLFSELEQICEQYKEQVPGRRRAWPKAVKERIEELERHGISGYEVSKRVPVPYMTIVSWRSKAKSKSAGPGFLPVKVVDERRPTTVTVKRRGRKPRETNSSPTTVTVVAPNGLRIEGLPIEFAMSLMTSAALAAAR